MIMSSDAGENPARALANIDATSLAEDKVLDNIDLELFPHEKADSIRASSPSSSSLDPVSPSSSKRATQRSPSPGVHEQSYPPPTDALHSPAPSVSDYFDPNLDVEASWFGECHYILFPAASQPNALVARRLA